VELDVGNGIRHGAAGAALEHDAKKWKTWFSENIMPQPNIQTMSRCNLIGSLSRV
jgi:hypothetical protein